MTVRTRVAPSPTGDPHVGTAYIALFNLAYARQHGGQFLLRIEDTDQARSTAESEQSIYDSLRWLGLEWDEGPDVGGSCGPYRQSERGDIYKEHINILLEKGHAFKCYRTNEELEELRSQKQEQGGYSALKFSDLRLSEEEQAKREAAGDSYVVRMHVPEEGVCTFKDELRGEIEMEWAMIDCQILMKSDGMPTYHLANVVDDHLMEITHVIRGEEWLSSAPKHQLLYKYFDWQMPTLIHMPLLRNPDKSKLSKRKNPTSILYYKRMGFLPEALLNYLGRMGWSMPDEREQFTRDEMFEHFDIGRVSLGGPIFDQEKLSWLNSQWLRDLSEEEFVQRFVDWGLDKSALMPVVQHVQPRVERLSDVVPLTSFLLSGMLDVTEQQFEHKKIEKDELVKLLQMGLWQLEAIRHWEKPEIQKRLFALAKIKELKPKEFLQPFFVAIAGTTQSFSVLDSMEVLGPDMSRARVRHAIEVLGGVSKKGMKKLEKEYRSVSSQIDEALAE
ncbi:glutamate--tRNA ligase [Bermanella marisrubri]|uniref:Glutamate--tRNA ligase n=1 Tax=Bermanella marisrubri TaxID=207949 RepID=Q1MXU9_9GAMM|nr:glutamate--tRNA ligase [Bermanella marisrubri]EAT10788.1 glutamyl-tRNA synthetase [Oceanobacter sp. RED65] [Bermanella marisrubri]QIZ84250.1 glutamate--tRNA ligase [Bermanella marisrubri]